MIMSELVGVGETKSSLQHLRKDLDLLKVRMEPQRVTDYSQETKST